MLTVTKTSIASETGFYISSLIKILTIIKQPLDCNCLIILFILTFLPQLLTKSPKFPYEKHRCRIKPTAVSFFTIEFLLLYFRLIPDNKLINELVELFFIR